MCQPNLPPRPPGRKRRRTDLVGNVAFATFIALVAADTVVVHEFPDCRLAHWQGRLWWGLPVAIIEADLRDLDEAAAGTAALLDRRRTDRDEAQADLNRGSLPPGLPDSAFARLVLRRDALAEEVAVLENRLANLRQAIDRHHEALARCRAERARHVEALHTQN